MSVLGLNSGYTDTVKLFTVFWGIQWGTSKHKIFLQNVSLILSDVHEQNISIVSRFWAQQISDIVKLCDFTL